MTRWFIQKYGVEDDNMKMENRYWIGCGNGDAMKWGKTDDNTCDLIHIVDKINNNDSATEGHYHCVQCSYVWRRGRFLCEQTKKIKIYQKTKTTEDKPQNFVVTNKIWM